MWPHLERAAIGYLVHDTLHERRFALAVAAHEGHFLAALDGQIDVGEDHMVAIGFLHALEITG